VTRVFKRGNDMNTSARRVGTFCLALLLLAGITSVGQAQRFGWGVGQARGFRWGVNPYNLYAYSSMVRDNPYRFGPPVNPYDPYGYSSRVRRNAERFAPLASSYGNYLQGAAQVVDARVNAVNTLQQGVYQGRMLEWQEAQGARRQEQPPRPGKAQAEGPARKGKALKQVQYEQLLTAGEAAKEQQATTIQRLLTNPLPSEITSGYAMNTLLGYLASPIKKGVLGPQVPLDQEQLKHINVTRLTGTTNAGNAALLRKGGRLQWPAALAGETQQRLDKLLPEAVNQATQNNRVDPALGAEVTRAVGALDKELGQKNRADEIDPASYLEAKRFLESLREAATLLKSAAPAGFLDGSVMARGSNVQELVQHMMAENLRFAPATPGTEPAYFDLYQALIAFATGTGAAWKQP
jgi:hypothetical protein